jgi:hypothetical protein
MRIEETAKPQDDRNNQPGIEPGHQAKEDPQPPNPREAARRVIERYGEALQRLANF